MAVGTGIVITSGKGGTGKTSLTGGIGTALARSGHRVLCLDADVGLRNLDIVLGMTESALMDFTDVISGTCSLAQAAVPHPQLSNLHLLTAPLTLPSDFPGQPGFLRLLDEARQQYDYVLIDSPAGLGDGFHLAVCGADRAIVVAVHDPSSLRDAQRAVFQLEDMAEVHLVVNRVRGRLLKQLGTTIDDDMDAVGLPLLGLVPEDPQVLLAAGMGQLLPPVRRGAALAFQNIAQRLTGQEVPLMRLR